MSPKLIGTCPECGASTEDGQCFNINHCERAQRQATEDAARDTAKATADVPRPAAFASSGRVD